MACLRLTAHLASSYNLRSLRRPPLFDFSQRLASPREFRLCTMSSSPEAADKAGPSRGSGTPTVPPQLLSVAPMMDWTDLHYRQLARLISRHTWLYTEMVVDKTLLFNPDHDRFLWFPPEQHPIACQLGGSDPDSLAAAAKIVESYGYDEINLNLGCPSDRVAGAGCFGAALMLRPELVADCCAAMAAAVEIPITVKCRLGVDDQDGYEDLVRFIHVVSTRSPVTHFIIHARKAHLKGLNPHQNRTIPPLRYHWVWALKRDFPHLTFSLNGGIPGLGVVESALRTSSSPLLGVMVGRAAYHSPWEVLSDADRRVFGAEQNTASSRRAVLSSYAAYADSVLHRWADRGEQANGWRGPSLRTLVKPLLGLFAGAPRARQWRAAVDGAFKQGHTTVRGLLEATMPVLLPETLDEAPQQSDIVELPLGAEALAASLKHWEESLPPTPTWLLRSTEIHTDEPLLGGSREEASMKFDQKNPVEETSPSPDGGTTTVDTDESSSWVLVDKDDDLNCAQQTINS